MPTYSYFIIGILIVAAAIGLLADKLRESRRHEVIRDRYGLATWSPVGPEPQLAQWVCTADPKGAGRRGARAIRGLEATRGEHRGFTFLAVNYYWWEAEGDALNHESRALVAADLPKPAPDLQIVRARPNSKSPVFGWQPFDEAFRVTASDLAFAQAVLTMPIMQWMLSNPRSVYFPVLFNGTTLSTVQKQKLEIHHLGAPADYLAEFLSRISREVWQ